jgi:hypothetical protein
MLNTISLLDTLSFVFDLSPTLLPQIPLVTEIKHPKTPLAITPTTSPKLPLASILLFKISKLPYMKHLLLVLLILSFGTAWSQKRVVTRGIIVTNEYDEYSGDHVSSPEFTARFLKELETTLKTQLGDITMIHPTEAKIHFMDPRLATTVGEAIAPFQEYYRQRAAAKDTEYDYLVDVRTDITDVFKGKESNIKVVTKVVVKDGSGKAVIRQTGKVNTIIPPPMFDENDLLINRVELKQNFPLSTEEFQDALCKSLNLAFEENTEVTVYSKGRPVVHDYDDFVGNAVTYRLLAPVNFAKSRFKMKINGFYTLTRNRPLDVSRLQDNRKGMLNFQETKITDLNVGLGVDGVYKRYRLQRNFRLGLDAAGLPASNYFIRGVMSVEQGILGTGSAGAVRLDFKGKEESDGLLKFTNNNPTSNELSQYNRSLGRMFSPFGKLEGTVGGSDLVVQSSMTSMNTLEVLIDGELAGVIAHPETTRKFLRKNKKMIPFIVYMSPNLTTEEQSLVLQAFQFNRLAYLLKDHQDHVVNQLASKNP